MSRERIDKIICVIIATPQAIAAGFCYTEKKLSLLTFQMSQIPFSLPMPLLDLVNRELESDERPVWIGQPIPRFFTAGATGAFLFAIPWTAFAIFWMCGASGFQIPEFGPHLFFVLFGLPFVLIGFAMLCTPVLERNRLKKSVYVVTDRRAIIICFGLLSTTIRSFEPVELKSIRRRERVNGIGDIMFDQDTDTQQQNPLNEHPAIFFNIPNAKEVERYIKELAKKAKPADHSKDNDEV